MRSYRVTKRWTMFQRIRSLIFYKLVSIIIPLIIKIKITGLENVPPEKEGTLLVCNHLSHLDSFIVGATLFPHKKVVHFMAAQDWMERWYFSWVKFVGAYPAGRGSKKRERTIVSSVALLNDGSTVCVFPEGERSRTGRWSGAKPGVGWIAHQADPNTNIIPVYIYGSQYLLPPGRMIPNIGTKIVINFGSALDLKEYYKMGNTPETSKLVTKEIVKGIIKQKDKFLEDYLS